MKIENLKEVKQYLEYFNIKIITIKNKIFDKYNLLFSIDGTVYILKKDSLLGYYLSISKYTDLDTDSNNHIFNTIGMLMQIRYISIDGVTASGSKQNRLSFYYYEDPEDFFTGGVPIGAFSIFYQRRNSHNYDGQIRMQIEEQRKKNNS